MINIQERPRTVWRDSNESLNLCGNNGTSPGFLELLQVKEGTVAVAL